MVWSQLIALGTPVECELTYKDATLIPGFEKATLYVKGDKFKEVLTTSQAGLPTTMTVVSNNDGFVYLTYSDSTMMNAFTQGKLACDGIKTPVNTTDSSTGTVDTSAFEDDDKVSLSCKPGVFGDEMFQVTGKFCTLKDITTAMTGGIDPCAQIEDPESKAQCQQALG